MERLAGKIMLLWGVRRALIAVIAGAIGVLALPPFGVFAAMFVSFTLLVWLLDGATMKPQGGLFGGAGSFFLIGWLFGFGYFLAGLWWLGNALMVEADEFAWALPFAIVGLPAFLAVFYGAAAALSRLLWSDGFGRIAALAAGFGIVEWLRSFVLTGFPWNAIGYGAMPVPVMMQSASVLGIFGVTTLAVFVFSAPALLGTRIGMVPGLALAIILSVAHVGFGAWRLSLPEETRPGDPVEIRLVQPSIDQSLKMGDRERDQIFEEHLTMSALPPEDGKLRPDIIIWPETSVPFILTERQDALTRIADVLDDDQILIAGAVRAEDMGAGMAPRYYNSIYVIDGKGQIIGASDKVHLVPFGEYVPFEDVLHRLGVDKAIAMPGGFSAAAARSPVKLPDGLTFYPLICYEIIFPQEVGPAEAGADAIVNLTNDAWFGDTPGPYQHLLQARIRAVETGHPVIRSANSGISAFIDARGKIISGLDFARKGVVDASLGSIRSPFVDENMKIIYFWLTIGAMIVIAGITRMGLVFRGN